MSIDDLIEASDRRIALMRKVRGAVYRYGSAAMSRTYDANHIRMSIAGVPIKDGLMAFDIPAQPSATKVRSCPECHAIKGHWGWCVGQGYSAVGPHPDAPAPATERAPARGPCPCGIDRADCEYHRCP